MITLQSGHASDIGRLRTVNQDSMLVSDAVFAVADGMGGHAGGEIASRLAVACLRRLAGGFAPDDVRDAVRQANAAILAAGAGQADRPGMGTTVAGIGLARVAGAYHWVVFNVGDSRVYRFAAGVLAQLTVDHTEIAELVAAGAVAAADAPAHPGRHVVTRALGSDPAPEADVWVFPPTPGERFLICSDGLCHEVAAAEVATVLGAGAPPQAAADELVRRAMAYGGRDDVSAIVVDYPGDAAEPMGDTSPRAGRAG